jgi:hypothetical protein
VRTLADHPEHSYGLPWDSASLRAIASSARCEAWCETWTEAKAIETEQSTHARYKRVRERFTGFLGEAKSKRDLSTLQASDVARFRDREAKELSRSTANLSVKVLRVCLGEAARQGLLTVNPAVRVKLLKSTAESKRRAFTLVEIKSILKACGDDTEWRGLPCVEVEAVFHRLVIMLVLRLVVASLSRVRCFVPLARHFHHFAKGGKVAARQSGIHLYAHRRLFFLWNRTAIIRCKFSGIDALRAIQRVWHPGSPL